MEGSEKSGGTRDERGTLIRFPRSDWIPADGIEPFSQADDGSAGEGGSPSSPTIEADDFWASGDTQEFVGVASAPGAPAPPRAPPSRQLRKRLPGSQFLAAVAATMLIAVAGVAVWQVSSSPVRVAKTSAGSSAARHGRRPATYASASGRGKAGSRPSGVTRQHRAVPLEHPKVQAKTATRHRAQRAHHNGNAGQAVPVSYEQAAPANSSASQSTGSSPPTYTPPQHSVSATTASTSGGSGSSSTSPPQPGPNGALTCISNCG